MSQSTYINDCFAGNVCVVQPHPQGVSRHQTQPYIYGHKLLHTAVEVLLKESVRECVYRRVKADHRFSIEA